MFDDVTAEYLRSVRTLTEEQVNEITAEHDHDDWTPAERLSQTSGHPQSMVR